MYELAFSIVKTSRTWPSPTREPTPLRGSQRSLTYSGKELAKTVIMKIEDALAMAVLPASYQRRSFAIEGSCGSKHVCPRRQTEFKIGSPTVKSGQCHPLEIFTECPFLPRRA